MTTSNKLKSIDFYRKIPRDLTEASLSGAGLSLVAAFAMVFLFGMELNNYLKVSTTTSIILDRSKDGEYMRIQFNMSFPALSCEFASVDVSDALGTNRINITKTVRKFPIDPNLKLVGPEHHPGAIPNPNSHGDEYHDGEGSVALSSSSFDEHTARYDVLVVNFYAPWCYWSNRLKPSWEKAASIVSERYDPDSAKILLAKVDCTEHQDLCRKHHIQGYPSIRIFHKGHDVKGDEHGHHEHDSYYGERDTESLVKAMVALVPEEKKLALEDKTENATARRPAPRAGGCRIEGFIRAKKVPGNLIISAHSESHSFDMSTMNMTHYVSKFVFGQELNYWTRRELYRIFPYLESVYDTPEANLTGKVYVSHHEKITHDHYLQVVKTEVVSLRKRKEYSLLEHYDYTSHSNTIQNSDLPVVKFHYELSPMQVLVKENSKSFSHFITNVCAIIGGVFTVAGIVDSMFHHAMRIVKKVELGKQF